MERVFNGITFTIADQSAWMLPAVLAERSRSHGDKTYLIEAEGEQRRWTYRQMHDQARTVGAHLFAAGFQPADRLAIMLPNCPEYLLAWYGAATIGVTEAPVNPDYTGYFLRHSITLVQPRGVVTSAELSGAFTSIADELPAGLSFYVLGTGDALASALDKLAACGWTARPFTSLLAADIGSVPEVRITPRDLGAIVSTGGTTGASKGVMMSHSHFHFFAEQLITAVRLREDDVYMLATPLFHGMAQFLTAYPAMVAGATVVMYARFSPSKFVDRLHETGTTVTNLIGVMTDWVWKQPPTDRDSTHQLRRILCAPTPPSIAEPFRLRFGLEAIVEVYGQTETSMNMMCPYGEPRPAGAVGLAVDQYFDLRIADPETDEELPVGSVGELQVRPKLPWIMNSGYWGMPDATAAARRNLWFHTGDALRKDEAGWFYFSDRLKDTIRRRGENIASFEVEQVIAGHPGVLECAVYGVASEIEGAEDEVMTTVVLAGGVTFSDVIGWLPGRMPEFFVPRFWRAMEALPKGPSERVQKEALRRLGTSAEGVFDRENP
jgi:carnitine-CoA ligase